MIRKLIKSVTINGVSNWTKKRKRRKLGKEKFKSRQLTLPAKNVWCKISPDQKKKEKKKEDAIGTPDDKTKMDNNSKQLSVRQAMIRMKTVTHSEQEKAKPI